jgi:hypothetical protein
MRQVMYEVLKLRREIKYEMHVEDDSGVIHAENIFVMAFLQNNLLCIYWLCDFFLILRALSYCIECYGDTHVELKRMRKDALWAI